MEKRFTRLEETHLRAIVDEVIEFLTVERKLDPIECAYVVLRLSDSLVKTIDVIAKNQGPAIGG